MDKALTKRPDDTELSPLAQQVLDILGKYTAFPWPVFFAQCRRVNHDPARLGPTELEEILPRLSAGVARFTSPQKGENVERELRALLSN